MCVYTNKKDIYVMSIEIQLWAVKEEDRPLVAQLHHKTRVAMDK